MGFQLATENAKPEDYPADPEPEEEEPAEDEPKEKTAESKSDVRAAEDQTIFVKNLPFDATVEQLKTLFVNATEIRILTKNNGSSRGKAFIEMKSVETAESVRGRNFTSFYQFLGGKIQRLGFQRSKSYSRLVR